MSEFRCTCGCGPGVGHGHHEPNCGMPDDRPARDLNGPGPCDAIIEALERSEARCEALEAALRAVTIAHSPEHEMNEAEQEWWTNAAEDAAAEWDNPSAPHTSDDFRRQTRETARALQAGKGGQS